jgi:hypothetical protein
MTAPPADQPPPPADQPTPADQPHPADQPPPPAGPTQNAVQKTRAWTGLYVIAIGDVAIAVAAIWGIIHASGSAAGSAVVAILTSAFTAIGTMTTAYFGIKGIANAAQGFVPQDAGGAPQGQIPPVPPNPPIPGPAQGGAAHPGGAAQSANTPR